MQHALFVVVVVIIINYYWIGLCRSHRAPAATIGIKEREGELVRGGKNCVDSAWVCFAFTLSRSFLAFRLPLPPQPPYPTAPSFLSVSRDRARTVAVKIELGLRSIGTSSSSSSSSTIASSFIVVTSAVASLSLSALDHTERKEAFNCARADAALI